MGKHRPNDEALAADVDLKPVDIERMFPADPLLMVSLEGDRRGLREVQGAARARLAQLRAEDH